MFMLSLRLTKGRILLGGLAVILVLTLCVTGIRRAVGGDSMTSTAPVSETGKVKVKTASGKTNEERLAFIQSFGWEVEEEAAEVLEVIIPKEFDEVYTAYNSIQKKQGLDLEGYAGKRCKRYSYTVTNYPDSQEPVRVNLLIYNNKIIGGDVCSLSADGFMHGFSLE